VSPAGLPVLTTTKSAKKKVKTENLNQELVGHVTHTSKTALFRNCKFIEDVKEEEDVTKDLIPFLPVKLPMPEEEFVENYKGVVYEGIKAARTDVQSTGKKRAQGTSNLCKIPTYLGICCKTYVC